MAEDDAAVARMQSAFTRAHTILKNAMFNSLAETVDRPWDGRELTAAEASEWTRTHFDNPTLMGALQAELSKKFHLEEAARTAEKEGRKPKLFARRPVVRMNQGLAERKREGD